MRETCARVLAAALLTGAIAAVVAMAAHLNGPNEAGTPIAAPSSSLQRTIRLTARPLPRHRSIARLVTTHTRHVRQQADVIHRSLVVVHRRRAQRRTPPPHRQLTASVPSPATTATVTTAPTPASAPATPTPVEAPVPVSRHDEQADGQGQGQGHGRGHAHSHDKQDD